MQCIYFRWKDFKIQNIQNIQKVLTTQFLPCFIGHALIVQLVSRPIVPFAFNTHCLTNCVFHYEKWKVFFNKEWFFEGFAVDCFTGQQLTQINNVFLCLLLQYLFLTKTHSNVPRLWTPKWRLISGFFSFLIPKKSINQLLFGDHDY